MTSVSLLLNSQILEVQRQATVHRSIPPNTELDVSPALYLTLERLKAKACMIFRGRGLSSVTQMIPSTNVNTCRSSWSPS